MAKNKKNNLIVRYDRAADALALVLCQGREERFEELVPGVVVEFDRNGRVLGFEILGASRHLKDTLKPLTERAREFALSKP